MCNPDFTDDDGIRKKIFACQNYTELKTKFAEVKIMNENYKKGRSDRNKEN